ncbi:conserved hypothetical protein [Talaromyces stipitatus ATCC 10500]|uniref:Uncharacterized protein n=1 Tax=Talaromyces stipitatus (strain ATCC 10500 / CBS 375.48 / QM 6759 / NRRL 1006) TaxID=441959 RepID=B8LYP9_TALSN|nr:uncharacterized protein TSTA_068340 [Talaromyces stipitatus ATCC 10500]EED23407.1 conserved hypothetical protein [Talaromyces stipitatus ATCC 10500]
MADQDEFAQTRGADDLFDDEIIPISGDQEIQQVTETATEQEHQQQLTDVATQQAAPTPRRNRGHGRGAAHADGGRGRGRGRGRGGRGSSDTGPRKDAAVKEATTETVETTKDTESTEKRDDTAEAKKEEEAESKTATKTENARVQAVRGDRSGTGGIKKPKLTEEELAERMAAAKLKAAKKAAAYARAEADEASFQQREKVAAEKRRQELANRKVMDSERERNRMRKLGAQTGREWDAEKKEEDYNGRRGGGSQYRRGMHGAVSGFARRTDQLSNGLEMFDDFPEFRGRGGRGRGGRGRGRGGAGRGGRGDSQNAHDRPAPRTAPGINNETEFPSLPGKQPSKEQPAQTENTSTTDKLSIPAVEKVASPGSPLSPAEGTWAEQVESSEAL